MKIAFSHPTGNANVRAAANGLLQADLLAEFHTSIACFPRSALGRLAEMPVFAELKRRSFDKQLQNLTHTWPYKEAGRLLSTRMGLKNMLKHEKGRFCIDAVYRYVDGQVASGLKKSAQRGVDAIYAYEDGALASFRVAKKLGLTCLYDLPIGYWRSARRFLLPEIEKWPDWASTLTGFNDSDTKLSHKDEELRLADCIFVASSFTAGTLNEYPGTLAPVKVIPYGFPPVREKLAGNSFAGNRPLKLLFVGGLSQRKGIADLFEAVRKVGRHAELTIVGNKTTAHCPALDSELVRHKWLPGLPHNN